jgi:15-cis-phytoene synthase
MTAVDGTSAGKPDGDAADVLRRGSSSFHGATGLLAPDVRESVTLLYAWCRRLDDLIDGQDLGHAGDGGPATPETIGRLRAATIAACRGERQDDPLFDGLRHVALRHGVPADEPLALIDGFAMDVAGRRYETVEDMLDYCHHVAGVVGLMMARILGGGRPTPLDRACDLGLAFQLTNIARDVVDDWRIGRVYLPRRWLAAEGLEPDDIGDPAKRAALHRVALRCVATAEPYYESARVGLGALPIRSAWAVGAALEVYREIGREVARAGPAAWDVRRVVGQRRKLLLTSAAAVRILRARARRPEPPPRPATLWSKAC